jgi:hypothetical protein
MPLLRNRVALAAAALAVLLIAPAAAFASTIPVTTKITLQAPQVAHRGVGLTFIGKVDGGAGCTSGRRIGFYQDAYHGFTGGQYGGFVHAGTWAGHSQGYFNFTWTGYPGRLLTHFYAVAIEDFREPSFAKPNRLDCKYAITAPLPRLW